MRENVDLERDILLYLEDKDEFNKGLYQSDFQDFINNSNFPKQVILSHCQLLKEAGLIKFPTLPADNEIYEYSVGPITSDGYKYLGYIRNNKTWGKIKDKIMDKGLGLAIDSILKFLPVIINNV